MTTIKIAQAFPHWAASFEPENPWAMPATGFLPLPYAVFKTSWPQLQKKLAKQYPGCVLEPMTK
jgi:hypothetical protein